MIVATEEKMNGLLDLVFNTGGLSFQAKVGELLLNSGHLDAAKIVMDTPVPSRNEATAKLTK